MKHLETYKIYESPTWLEKQGITTGDRIKMDLRDIFIELEDLRFDVSISDDFTLTTTVSITKMVEPSDRNPTGGFDFDDCRECVLRAVHFLTLEGYRPRVMTTSKYNQSRMADVTFDGYASICNKFPIDYNVHEILVTFKKDNS